MNLYKIIENIKRHKMVFRFSFITLFIFVSFNGCKMDSDMKWQSFTSTGRTISSSYNYWRYEHYFSNLSTDRVLLRYESGKNEYGFTEYNESVIHQNGSLSIVATFYDFMSQTPYLYCSVGTYDGRDLVIERSTGRIVFRDKE